MKNLAVLGALGLCFMIAPYAHAQRIAVGVGVGPVGVAVGAAPVCQYGYYGAYPYACAPYGYYGPDWFTGGVFVGAGPWFHGVHPFGFYSRPGFYNRGFVGRPGFYNRGFVGRAPAVVGHGPVRGGAIGHGPAGGFHGGNSFHGGGTVHEGGSFHGGGSSHGNAGGSSHGGGHR